MALINPRQVEKVFDEVLWDESQDGANFVTLQGVTRLVKFNPHRLHKHSNTIVRMLWSLPGEFRLSGGASLTAGCYDQNGHRWADDCNLWTVEQLILLGVAIGKAEFFAPRHVWQRMVNGEAASTGYEVDPIVFVY